jgi:DNA-binding CsgD family transcriptional regulator
MLVVVSGPSPARELAHLRDLLTSGIDIMTQMPLTSVHLHRVVPSFSLSMIRVDARCAPQEHYSEHFDEQSHRLFASSGHHFAAPSTDPAAFANLMRQTIPYGTLVETAPSYVEGAIYQHLFKRNGIHHTLDVAVRDATGPLAILGIFREKKARHFTSRDVARIAEIYPFLVHAFAARPLPTSFDEVAGALIVASRAGVIRWASPEARAWLEDASGGPERAMLMDHDVLPRACRQLCGMLERARLTRAKDTTHVVPELVLSLAGGRLRLRAYQLVPAVSGASESAVADGDAYVGIQLSLEMHRGLRVFRALEQCALSPQQRRLALALWDGKSPAEILDDLGVTPSTLKSYQRDLYARLGVRSASQLVEHLEAMADSVTFDLHRHRPRPS